MAKKANKRHSGITSKPKLGTPSTVVPFCCCANFDICDYFRRRQSKAYHSCEKKQDSKSVCIRKKSLRDFLSFFLFGGKSVLRSGNFMGSLSVYFLFLCEKCRKARGSEVRIKGKTLCALISHAHTCMWADMWRNEFFLPRSADRKKLREVIRQNTPLFRIAPGLKSRYLSKV